MTTPGRPAAPIQAGPSPAGAPTPRPRAGSQPGSGPASSPGLPALLAALFVVSLALRPQIAAIGPLAPRIVAELGTSFAFVGLLTAIPVLCMGLFAPFGPSLARRIGVRAGIAASVAILAGFGVARAVLPGPEWLLVLTFGVGVGTGLVGPMLPMFVRGRLPGHLVGGTAAYAGGISIGAALASALAVVLADAAGGWRGSLLLLSAASFLPLAAWGLMVRRAVEVPAGVTLPPPAPRGAEGPRLRLPVLPWRRPVAWAIGLLFGMQSWLYYGTTAWLVSAYVEYGWAPGSAALLLAIVSALSLVAIVIVPYASRRGASRRSLLVVASVAATTALGGVVVVPGPGIAWAAILGVGLGMTFTLVLALPADIGRDARDVGAAAAMMLLVGYLMASVAPFVMGAVRDATGDFRASLWLMVAIAAFMVPLAWTLAPGRLRPARTAVVPGP